MKCAAGLAARYSISQLLELTLFQPLAALFPGIPVARYCFSPIS